MSQLLFIRGRRATKPPLSGFDLKAVKKGAANLLDGLFGAVPDNTIEWFEVGVTGNDDFAMFFDSHFQSLEGRDPQGQSIRDVLTNLADRYDDIVLAYGTLDSEIERVGDPQKFMDDVVSSYERVPVELHSALIRSC